MDISSYKRHCQQLDLSKFNGDIDEACMFYFRLLQELGVQIASVRGQIENLKSTVSENKPILKSSKNHCLEKEEQIEEKRMEESESHSEEEKKLYCEYKGCNEYFTKSSRLALHKMLKHRDPPVAFNQNKIFNVEIKNCVEGRRPSRY